MRGGLLLGLLMPASLAAGLLVHRLPPASAWAQGPAAWVPGEYAATIEAAGLTRRYVVHVPAGYDGARAIPLVIMLHGAGGSADEVLRWTGWAEQADRAGFLAVAPDGTNAQPGAGASADDELRAWNDGSGRGYPADHDVDDVAFVGRLIDDVRAQFAVDERRVYTAGFSNGASMAYRLGVELADRIAAVAPVAGHLWIPPAELRSPVSLFYTVGGDDGLNPPSGGDVDSPWVGSEWKPAPRDSVGRWAAMLGCPPDARAVGDASGVRIVGYGPCRGDAEILWYTIEGLGHSWPEGGVPRPPASPDAAGEWVSATEAIWDFFQRHSKP